MHLSRIILAALALAPFLVACRGNLPPFDTTPKPAPPDAHENFSRIGVCYNALTTTRAQVEAVARGNCDPGTAPSLLDDRLNLDCPLLLPRRATFACRKPGAASIKP